MVVFDARTNRQIGGHDIFFPLLKIVGLSLLGCYLATLTASVPVKRPTTQSGRKQGPGVGRLPEVAVPPVYRPPGLNPVTPVKYPTRPGHGQLGGWWK